MMRRFDTASNLAPIWDIPHVIAYAMLCLLAFAPYMVIFCPGIVEIDTSFQLAMAQGFGYGTIENYPSPFPPFDIRLLGVLYSIGEAIRGTQNGGIFAICLFQCSGIAISISLMSCYLSRWKVPAPARLASFLFLALIPIVPLAAVDLGKDTIFCEFFVPFSICLVELVRKTSASEKAPASLIVSAIIFGFLSSCAASKGFVIVMGSVAVAFLFALKRKSVTRKPIACVLGVCLTLQLVMSVAVLPVMSSGLPSTAGASLREGLGTFVQQISWAERVSGDLSDSEREKANRFFDLDAAAENYSPSASDNTKVFTHRDATMGDAMSMLEAYVSVGLSHPKEYLKSFVDLYEGYWKLGTADSTMIPRIMPVGGEGGLDWKGDTFSFPGTIDQAIEHVEHQWVCYSFGLLPEYAEAHPDFGQWGMSERWEQARADVLALILAWGKVPVLNLLVSKSLYVLYAPLALLLLALLAAGKGRRWVALCLAPLGLACVLAFLSPADLTRYAYPCMFLVPMLSAIVLACIIENWHKRAPVRQKVRSMAPYEESSIDVIGEEEPNRDGAQEAEVAQSAGIQPSRWHRSSLLMRAASPSQ